MKSWNKLRKIYSHFHVQYNTCKGDDCVTRIEDVKKELLSINDERFVENAAEWSKDEIRMNKIAISHDEFVADAKEHFHLEGTVYLALEHDYLIKNGMLKGMVTLD